MKGITVKPYWELTFDADGDVDTTQRAGLTSGVTARGVTDLIVFSHGWNSDRSGATRLHDRFLRPVPGLLRGATAPANAPVPAPVPVPAPAPAPAPAVPGYVGVLWPSMRFSDEPIPDFEPTSAVTGARDGAAVLDDRTRRALAEVFPGGGPLVGRLAALLEERPDDDRRIAEFVALTRRLTGVDGAAVDTTDESSAVAPAMLVDDPVAVCEVFAASLEPGLLDGLRARIWNGAHEVLRQATYYAMKRRAGTVGEHGLGPALGAVAAARPGIRIHLVGHSFGGRVVSFALRGLPDGVRAVKSVTLLQGAFSHYAFAAVLPHDHAHGGALRDVRRRVDGPVVSCWSAHDSSLGTMYPLASKLAGDDRGLFELSERWGAMGHDGMQAVDPCARLTLAQALGGALPASGCVNVDVSAVVRAGGPPSGAHSDICHEELTRLVLRAARLA